MTTPHPILIERLSRLIGITFAKGKNPVHFKACPRFTPGSPAWVRWDQMIQFITDEEVAAPIDADWHGVATAHGRVGRDWIRLDLMTGIRSREDDQTGFFPGGEAMTAPIRRQKPSVPLAERLRITEAKLAAMMIDYAAMDRERLLLVEAIDRIACSEPSTDWPDRAQCIARECRTALETLRDSRS